MVRVFISYSTHDVQIVSRVALRLDESGIFTFFAAVDVRPGMDLIEWMNTSLEQSTHLLLFWSEKAASSRWVQEEWKTRFWGAIENTSKTLIPIRLDETPLPSMLQRIMHLNMLSGEDAVVEGILKAILPDVDFRTTRLNRLRDLSGFNIAATQVAVETQHLITANPENVQVAVYDFYYPPREERVFLSLLRSTGVQSIVSMERKGIAFYDGAMRLTGHLEAPQSAFDYMQEILLSHGYRFEKVG